MKTSEFEMLVNSIKEAGSIKKGEVTASCKFEFAPPDIKLIRKRLKKSKNRGET